MISAHPTYSASSTGIGLLGISVEYASDRRPSHTSWNGYTDADSEPSVNQIELPCARDERCTWEIPPPFITQAKRRST
jgi:hypothetical protein